MKYSVIRILVITEGKLRTDRSTDGIGAMLDAVERWRSEIAKDRFRITRVQINEDDGWLKLRTAIRDGGYDQIWLFGSGSPTKDDYPRRPLKKRELEALREFMQAGGGVFATGDHEDVGASLCAKIPRVRHMRSWGVGGFSPAKDNSSRADTVFASRFKGDSDSEQDAIGKPIWVRCSEGQPHPLMKGYAPLYIRSRAQPAGSDDDDPPPPPIIRWLPDHMHEGECRILPGGFNVEVRADFTEGAQTEIVAWSMKRGFSDEGGRSENQPSIHGVVCCYDGHPHEVGRVVVDSTFHHWTEENTAAMRSSSIGQDLDSYPVNIAQWLSKAINSEPKRIAMVHALGQQKDVLNVRDQKSHVKKFQISMEPSAVRLTEQQYNLLLGETAEAVWAANGLSVLVLRETLEKIRAAERSMASPGGTANNAAEAVIDGKMAAKKDWSAAIEAAAENPAEPMPESGDGPAIAKPLSVPEGETPVDGGESAEFLLEEGIAIEMPLVPEPVIADKNHEGATIAIAWERTGKLLDTFLGSSNGPEEPE